MLSTGCPRQGVQSLPFASRPGGVTVAHTTAAASSDRHQGGAGADQGTPRQSAPRFCPLFPGISLHIPAQAPLEPTSAAGAENPALLQHRLDVCPSSLWLGPSSPRWLHPHLAGSILTLLAPGVQAQRGAGQSSLSAGGHCAEGPYGRGRCPKAQHHAEPPSPAPPAPTAGFARL